MSDNPYKLTEEDVEYFNRGTQPMRRKEDGTLGPDLTQDELTEAMRRAGADEQDTLLSSQLFDRLEEVIGERK